MIRTTASLLRVPALPVLVLFFSFIVQQAAGQEKQPPAAAQKTSQEPLVTVNIKNRPLPEALAIIETRVPIRFAYPTDLLHNQPNVSITATAMPLKDLLAALFHQTTLSYKLIGDQVVLQAPTLSRITLHGYIRDARTGEVLIGASIYSDTTGTLSNNYGFYSLTMNIRDSTAVEASYIGYQTQKRLLTDSAKDTPLSFDLQLDTAQEHRVTFVKDKREDFVKKNPPGLLDIGTQMIAAPPSINGSGDVLGSMEMLPGVQAGIDGTPGYFVRGGNTGQNLILLDDATLYNPSHIFGLVGTFDPPNIKSVTLLKGGFPANYGDHVSSVLDVVSKDGSNHQLGGVVQMGSVTSGATLYGPLQPGRSSFLISGRRSTTDFLLEPFLKNNYFRNYYFYDVNAKLNFQPTTKDRILLSFYTGRDNNTYASDSTDSTGIGYSMHFGNTAVTARWNHQYSGKLFSNTIVEYNNYHQFLSATQQGYFAQLYSGIRDVDARTNLEYYLSPQHTITSGIDYLYQTLYPGSLSGKVAPADSSQNIVPGGLPPKTASRIAAYAGDEIKLGQRWQAYIGLRAPFYDKPDAHYFSLEPRFTLLYLLDPMTSLKFSYTSMHQYIHLVQSYNATFPAEIWIGSNSVVRPQNSQELTAGLYRNFAGNAIQGSIEVYYKKLNNQLLFGGVATPSIDNSIDSLLIFGKGWDYGAEFLLRKNRGRFTGWLAYTLAYAYEQFDSLNQGERFPFAYDRRHMLDLSVAYALTSHWKISANFLFATGRAFSLSPDSTYVPGSDPLYTSPGKKGRGRAVGRNRNVDTTGSWDIVQNNYRLSPYNRLDLSVHYTKTRTTARRTTTTEWVFSVYNAYARNNNSFVYRTIDPTTRKVIAKELPLIPVIPSITYMLTF